MASPPASVRYLIVDDEAPSRTNLRLALAAHAGWTLIGECDGAAAARTAIAAHEPEVIFLDIQMPGESGLALARDIVTLHAPPLIVFVTAYSEHAVDAFEVHALDYLLKPLDDARLAQAVARIEAMLRQRQREAYAAALRDYVNPDDARHMEHINVRSVGSIEQVRVGDILWIESAGNYVELHLAARTVLHRITLNRIETLLDAGEFVRVHRGAIVRRDQIASLATTGDGTYQLTLRCGGMTAVSERYLGALKSLLKAM
jgi:two-component system LytT family response regulator